MVPLPVPGLTRSVTPYIQSVEGVGSTVTSGERTVPLFSTQTLHTRVDSLVVTVTSVSIVSRSTFLDPVTDSREVGGRVPRRGTCGHGGVVEGSSGRSGRVSVRSWTRTSSPT